MYTFKYIVQIQKWEWEDVITRKINIGRHKVRINITIKKIKKNILILLLFFIQSSSFLLYFY